MPENPRNPLAIGFLLSGGGRTLENLVHFLGRNPGIARITLVVSDRQGAYGLERARHLGIPSRVIPCRSPEDSSAVFDALEESGASHALLGGFLRLLRIPSPWERRVLNIHPYLIPRFCGKGFYGMRVHEAVIAAGEKESGCTVHFVDNIYDHGAILLQEKVPVCPEDTPESLADRVFEAECRAYPRALEILARGQIEWREGRLRIAEEPTGG
ncbi:MAG: formyltransferase family protein [Planctomycetota bacterium]